MAALLHSESKRMCSWWWDSHISPKNSKWLQENLTDMDAKVKAMIKLINEDADSFARRAEMYYKKRPELMKLVEEFYRAYRALAERYNQATGELRQAHRTMAEAFPDQVQFKLNDDTSSSSEPPSPLTSLQIRSFFDSDDLNKESDVGFGKKGLKQLNDMFLAVERITQDSRSADSDLKREAGSSLLCDDNQSPKATCYHASEIGGKAEADIYWLKEALAKVKAERDGILVQYKESLEKLCDLEEELGLAGKDAERLTDLVHESGCEVEELKELLRKVEAERDQNLDQYNESMKRVATLESALTTLQDDSSKLSSHASEAEAQSEALKEELSRAEVEKKAAFVQYEACLEKIFSLENKLLLSEENAKMLTVENERTQNQIKALQDDVSRLEKAKDDLYLRYQECLHTISELQRELRQAKEDVKRLSGEVLMGSAKLKCAEDQCASLQELNQSLKLEADDLVQRITAKDQQLSEKQDEFENLANRLHDERSRFLQVETALLSLQNLHFQSQEEQRTLALELRNGLQMLKDLEVCKRDLEEEIKDLREENHGLNDLKSASSVTQKNMEAEISNLREINAKLEAEVIRQAEKNDVLQQQVHRLKQEIEDLHKKYLDILQQIESSGIDPNCIGSSIMDLRAENSRLKQTSSAERLEKEALFKKLADMDLLLQRSATLESSLSDVNTELECSKENVKALQDSCSVLSGDRAALVGEKSALLSQLHMVTESMQKLLEKNASLETSLLSANTELEGLRVKSKSLEDFCKLLNDERSSLLTERSSLVSRLEYVEKKLENLETRFTKLEDKYAYLEKEKVSTLSQVEELKVSLVVERKERASLVLTSETRLSGLEDRVENLQQENKSRKKEFEEQVEKAVNAQVEIFIMQKFMQDMEQKNYSLLVECQKHAEAARYSEKIISELENENMMNQLETEFLLDRMAKLRSGVCQLLKAFEIDHLSDSEPENLLSVVLGNAKSVKRNLSKITDENHKLLVENNVLTALIQQVNLEGLKLASCKETLDQEFSLLNQKNVLLEQENSSLMAQSRQLDILVDEKERGQETLMAELGDLNTKQAELQREYAHLQEQHLSVTINSRHLEGKLMVLQQEKLMLEEENHSLTTEALSLSNQCEVFRVYGAEKAMELDGVAQDMRELLSAYQDLDNEADVFRKKLTEKEIENLLLKELILSSGEMNKKLSGCNDQLIRQLQSEKEIVGQKEAALLDAKLKIKATVDSNAEMHRAIEDLHKQCEGLEVTREGLEGQVLKLCDDKEHQGKEIGRLREDNERLESEIDELGAELEEYKIREVILSSELSERSSEFELWEAEATSFYFDLQISSLREVLLENKMNELTGLCEGLEDVNCEKSLEVERVNLQKSILQEEINKLKTQLDAYGPAVAFLKEHISSLERNPILQPSLSPDGSLEPEVEAFTLHDVEEIKSLGSPDRSLPAQDTLSALQELQGRIKTIESALVDGMLRVSKQEHMKSHSKVEAAMKQIEELRLKLHAQSDRTSCESERKTRTSHAKLSFDTSVHDQSSEIRNGADMKDIPLDHVSDSPLSSNRRRRSGRRDDQMLELWETEEQDSGCDSTPQQKQTQKNGLRRNGGMNYQLEIREDISSMGSSQMAKDLGVDTMVRTKTLTETKHGGNNKRVIVERLTSDAQMLMNLRMSVQDSRKKLETNRRSQKSSKAFEYERLRTQLEEVENSVNELVEMNAELVKTANANHKFLDADVASFHLLEAEQAQRKKLSELARRESERIGRLQLEMQRIQYVLLNMENEKRLNTADSSSSSTINQGKNRSRTGFILSKFIYNRGNRSPRKQKKPRFCGCFKHTRRGEP